MSTSTVPRNTRWSFHALVREHGVEAALALLQYQPGLGEFTEQANRGWAIGHSSHMGYQFGYVEQPRDEEVHDEIPAEVLGDRLLPVPLCYSDELYPPMSVTKQIGRNDPVNWRQNLIAADVLDNR